MSGNIKGLTVVIDGNVTKLSKAIATVNTDSKKLQRELKGIDTLLKFDPKNTVLLTQKQKLLNDQIELQGKKLEDLKEKERGYAEEKDGFTDEQMADYRNLQREIVATEKKLQEAQRAMTNFHIEQDLMNSSIMKSGEKFEAFGGKIKKAGSKLESVGSAFSRTVTPAIVATGAATVAAAVEIDTSLTNVKKTVDGTDEQYQALKESAIEFSKTNAVSASQILDIQALGAQLGFTIDELDEFGQVVSGLDIATNMNAEQAATEMAQFANITQLGHDKISNYGSAIVGLGNSFATTEADISSMAMRLAASGTQVGMSQADILGLATALTSMGMEAEAGGSAMSTIMAQIDKDVAMAGEAMAGTSDLSQKEIDKVVGSLGTWASAANMTADEFSQAWKEKPVEALSALISGMDGATEEGSNMSVMLDELGITSLRQTDTMKRLAGNSDFLAEAVAKSNEEWDKNTALQAEVDNRNESLAAQFEIIKNKVIAMADEVGGPLAEALLDVIDAAEPLIKTIANGAKKFSEMTKEQQQTVLKAVALAAAFGPVTNVLGKVGGLLGGGVTALGKFQKQMAIVVTTAKNGKGDLTGFGASIGGFASKSATGTKAVSALAKGLSAASKAVPILGGALLAFEAVKFIAEMERLANGGAELDKRFEEVTSTTTDFNKAMQDATATMPENDKLVSASGKTFEDLNTTISDAENGITSVIQTALDEQRGLRQEDIDSINGYKQQIADAYSQKKETILTLMRTEAEETSGLMGDLTDQEIAQSMVNIDAKGQAALDAENENYDKLREALAEQYSAGLISQDEYNSQSLLLRQNHRDEIERINSEEAEAYEIIGKSLEKSKDDVILAFGKMTSVASTETVKVRDQYGLLTGETETLRGNTHITADEFKSAWNSMSEESKSSASAVLTSAGQIGEAGGEMDDKMKIAIESILVNFDGLKGKTGEAGRDALIELAGGMEQELSGVTDWSAMSADEIVEAIKTHLNLGDISREEVDDFVLGLQNGVGPVQTATADLSDATKTELVGLPDFTRLTGEDAMTKLARGMYAGSGNVVFAAGSVGEKVISELTGKDYSQTGIVVDQGMAQGLGDGFEAALAAAGLGDDVIDAIMEALDSHSPSRRAKAAGETVPAGLKEGIEGSDEPGNAAHSLGETVIARLGEVLDLGGEKGTELGGNYAIGVGSQADNANTNASLVASLATTGLGTGSPNAGSTLGAAYARLLGLQSGNANAQGSTVAGSASSGLGTGTANAGTALGSEFGRLIGLQSLSARLKGALVARSADEGLGSVSAGGTGANFVRGFRDGFGRVSVWSAAYNIGLTALNAIKSALGIASPSKEAAKLAEFTVEGYVNDLEDRESDVYDAGFRVGTSAIEGIDDSISKKSKSLRIALEEAGSSVTLQADPLAFDAGAEQLGDIEYPLHRFSPYSQVQERTVNNEVTYSFGDLNFKAEDLEGINTFNDFIKMLQRSQKINPTKHRR